MSSNKYQDVLSVTKEDEVTLHAIDTLDLDKDLKPRFIRNQPQNPRDLFDGMDEIPYKFIGKIEGEDEEDEFDLPW